MGYNKGKNNASWVDTPLKNKTLLNKEFNDNMLSYTQIAKKYGVSKSLVARLIKKFNITVNMKKRMCIRGKKQCGDNNPNWRGGRKICPICNEIKIDNNSKSCMGCRDNTGKNNGMFGKTHSKAARKIIADIQRKRMLSNDNPMNNPESVKKLRIKALERINNRIGQAVPNYNPNACKIIEKYGQLHNYNFQHAENGGEYHIKKLGYFVDGYDHDNNVVIEYYENAHLKTKAKDEKRKQEICNHLNCKFIELKEWNDE